MASYCIKYCVVRRGNHQSKCFNETAYIIADTRLHAINELLKIIYSYNEYLFKIYDIKKSS